MSQKHHDASHNSQMLTNLQFFSIAEVAAILGVSRKLVRQWIYTGRLPVFRLGPQQRLIRIRKADLEQFIEAHTQTHGSGTGADLA
jgi:excisionase family DNA binding protein